MQSNLTCDNDIPAEANLHFPGGLADALNDATQDKGLMISTPFAELAEHDGQRFEWAITWLNARKMDFSTVIATPCLRRQAARMNRI